MEIDLRMIQYLGGNAFMDSDSILDSVKKLLGILPDQTEFDDDIILNINASLNKLTQAGVGDPSGFYVVDKNDTWSSFLNGDPRLNMVKRFVFLDVKRIFDPGTSSTISSTYKEEMNELLWRLNVYVDQGFSFN